MENKIMKIGLIQSSVSEDPGRNMDRALREIDCAAKDGADIVVLGEMFCCPYENAWFVKAAMQSTDPSLGRLSDAAAKNRVYLIAGSVPLREEGKIYNASFVFDREGRVLACHKKVHLFDIDVKGGQYFKESDTFTAGDQITVFDTEFGKMGLCICFDMRFPELSELMMLQGAKCIFVPAAFNMTTGPAHWEILFRQRAVDNQLYTVAVSQARGSSGYIAYGNSLVCDPWGTVVWRADEKEVTKTVEIDLGKIESVRTQLPLLHAKRWDLYDIAACNRH